MHQPPHITDRMRSDTSMAHPAYSSSFVSFQATAIVVATTIMIVPPTRHKTSMVRRRLPILRALISLFQKVNNNTMSSIHPSVAIIITIDTVAREAIEAAIIGTATTLPMNTTRRITASAVGKHRASSLSRNRRRTAPRRTMADQRKPPTVARKINVHQSSSRAMESYKVSLIHHD